MHEMAPRFADLNPDVITQSEAALKMKITSR